MTLRYRFWSWAFRKADYLASWIYLRKLEPLMDPIKQAPLYLLVTVDQANQKQQVEPSGHLGTYGRSEGTEWKH